MHRILSVLGLIVPTTLVLGSFDYRMFAVAQINTFERDML